MFLFKLYLGWVEQARNEVFLETFYLPNTHCPFLIIKKKKQTQKYLCIWNIQPCLKVSTNFYLKVMTAWRLYLSGTFLFLLSSSSVCVCPCYEEGRSTVFPIWHMIIIGGWDRTHRKQKRNCEKERHPITWLEGFLPSSRLGIFQLLACRGSSPSRSWKVMLERCQTGGALASG